jgi:type II secretory pathway pseudopilin PulG
MKAIKINEKLKNGISSHALFGAGKSGKRGFSLIEMLIATFLFIIMTIVVMQTFFSVIESRKRVRAVQQDVEDARYAMELMAKTIRMSSVFNDTDGTFGNIVFYDYSQDKCIQYRRDPATSSVIMEEASANKETKDDGSQMVSGCGAIWSPAADSVMVSGGVEQLYFDLEKSKQKSSGTKKMGHVTMGMKVCYDGDCDNNDSAFIQSSVSLRDYGYASN